ncbi:hypothetical protein MIMGU_mgv1a018480mg [Erythranthe guttata]|uniref:Late embryogenesis abundant protein LEA-2 subgroup domain-containing protein n=1 Tax=Erythranthe guttata TaxID=4155 RepID=A0A022QQR9_ERYGU|nr:hypothetical protein MIMGU_mgv1a018480mg [Erythranthe guttata]
MAKSSDEEEVESLFRSYPYAALYLVQSPPSTVNSHATASSNYNHLHHLNSCNNNSPISHYSSSRGSNNSFLQAADKKKLHSHEALRNGNINNSNNINEAVILDDRDYYYGGEEKKRGWIKYLSFGYSNSGMWILVQLSWRFLLSLIIALFVFYIAAKPPPPNISIKIGGIGGFRLAEGVDGSGASTKILSCNCSIDLIIENKSKLFGLHINPPFIQLLFGHLPFAVNKAMYGAGRNMQDLLESGQGLPLLVKVKLRSSFHVIWGIFQPKFHHQLQCLVVLSDKYDKIHRTQVYNSTCISN